MKVSVTIEPEDINEWTAKAKSNMFGTTKWSAINAAFVGAGYHLHRLAGNEVERALREACNKVTHRLRRYPAEGLPSPHH